MKKILIIILIFTFCTSLAFADDFGVPAYITDEPQHAFEFLIEEDFLNESLSSNDIATPTESKLLSGGLKSAPSSFDLQDFNILSGFPMRCYFFDFSPSEYFYLASALYMSGLDITSSTTPYNIFVNLTDSAISMIRNYGNFTNFEDLTLYYPKALIDELKLVIGNSSTNKIDTHAYTDSSLYSNIVASNPIIANLWDNDINAYNQFTMLGFNAPAYVGYNSTGYYQINMSSDFRHSIYDSYSLPLPDSFYYTRSGVLMGGDINRTLSTSSPKFTSVTPIEFDGGYIYFESIPQSTSILNYIQVYDYLDNVVSEPAPPSILKYNFDNLRNNTSDILSGFVSLFSFDSIYFYFLVLFILMFAIITFRRFL